MGIFSYYFFCDRFSRDLYISLLRLSLKVFEDGYLYNLVNLIALSMAAVFVVLYVS